MALDLRLLGGSGRDLLICHATGFHGLAYAPLAEGLGRRFRVWAMDYRGHGSSGESPSNDYGWAAMSHDTAACAEAIGADALYGFGHSMGGAALLGACENGRPGLFSGLFLYEPIVFPPGWFSRPSDNPLSGVARRRREVFESRAEALARYAARRPLSVLRADALSAYVQAGFVELPDGRVRLACRAETEARTFEGSGYLDLDQVGGIEVPTVVAAGTMPGFPDPAQFAPVLAERLPRGRYLRCENLGHFGPLEAPDAIAAAAAAELSAGL